MGATHTLSYLITGVLSVVAILFLSPVAKFLDLDPALILLLLIYLFSGGTINISQSENRYCYDYRAIWQGLEFLAIRLSFLALVLALSKWLIITDKSDGLLELLSRNFQHHRIGR